jgi:hypothetical protein
VDNAAHTDGLETLRGKFTALPWDALEDSAEAMKARYLGSAQIIEDFTLTFDETRAAAGGLQVWACHRPHGEDGPPSQSRQKRPTV